MLDSREGMYESQAIEQLERIMFEARDTVQNLESVEAVASTKRIVPRLGNIVWSLN